MISTRVGAEGLRVHDRGELKVVDRIEEMAAELVTILRNPAPALAWAERGRRLVEEEYDWRILADRLERSWQQTVQGFRCLPTRDGQLLREGLVL